MVLGASWVDDQCAPCSTVSRNGPALRQRRVSSTTWPTMADRPRRGKARACSAMPLREVRLQPRGARCVLHRERASRAAGAGLGCLHGRERAGDREVPQGRGGGGQRRGTGPHRCRQDPGPAPGVRQGRAADGGILLEDFRWRRRGRADVGRRGRAPRDRPAGAHRGAAGHAQAPDGHHRAGEAISRVLAKAAGRSPTSTCSRSTRRSRASPWRPCTISTFPTPR